MNCPYCPEVDLRTCSCIKDKQEEIINSISRLNDISIISTELIEKIEEIMKLNEILIESSTRAYDAKFYIGRRTGMNIIKQLLIKLKQNELK